MQFRVRLGIAYYNQGFFNIGVVYSNYFGEHGSPINIQLGNNKEVIAGYINRTANRNGTPRIMIGKTYTEWVQSKFKQGEYMRITIINPDLLHLHKD